MISANTQALFICKRALADIGTRSTILSVIPPDGSVESTLCAEYYGVVLLQLLRAANWNFAARTNLLTLWKALPGTPENPTPATVSGWSPSYPAPPWTYSYIYPSDCVRARKLIGQPQQVPIAPPIFSGSAGTNPPISQRLPMARFEVSTDVFDSNGRQMLGLSFPPVISNPGSGHNQGDVITLAGGTLTSGAAYAPFAGRPAAVQVIGPPGTGGTAAAIQVLDPGTYSPPGPTTLTQASTTGTGSGLVLTVQPTTPTNNPVWAPIGQPVISTQQEFPLLEYTYWDGTAEPSLDPSFSEAFVAALAGRLCTALTGDKALANQKYALANELIINARTTDANEGLTIDDHLPDWLLVRGAGGGLGYEQFFYPLGPLFPVAPLI